MVKAHRTFASLTADIYKPPQSKFGSSVELSSSDNVADVANKVRNVSNGAVSVKSVPNGATSGSPVTLVLGSPESIDSKLLLSLETIDYSSAVKISASNVANKSTDLVLGSISAYDLVLIARPDGKWHLIDGAWA